MAGSSGFRSPGSWARGPVGPWLVVWPPAPDFVARVRGPVGPWLVGFIFFSSLLLIVWQSQQIRRAPEGERESAGLPRDCRGTAAGLVAGLIAELSRDCRGTCRGAAAGLSGDFRGTVAGLPQDRRRTTAGLSWDCRHRHYRHRHRRHRHRHHR